MKFNENLLNLRKQKGWSQEELGYKLNVSRQTVSKWEAGQTTPELEKLELLAKIFNISIDELVGNNTEKNNFKKKKILKKVIIVIFILLFFLLLGFFTYRFYIVSSFEKELDKLYETEQKASNYSITEEVINIDGYMQKYGECVQIFYRDGKVNRIHYSSNVNVNNIVRIEHINFDYKSEEYGYYYDIDEENKTYKKFKSTDLDLGMEQELMAKESIQSEVKYKFDLNSRLRDKLKMVFDMNKHIWINNLDNQYALSKSDTKYEISYAICGDNFLRLSHTSFDKETSRKSKSMIYTLRIGNTFESDVELPDLSEYTLIEK